MQVKRQQLEPDMEQQTSSKLGKEYIKAVYCHPAYLTYMQSTSCEMLGWMNHRLESKFLGEISTTSAMQIIKKMKIMAPGTTTVKQIEGEIVEAVTYFVLLSSKVTVDGDSSHEIKRHLLLERKAMTNLESRLKNKDVTLQTKVCIVKATVFPVVMYGSESWSIKKDECQRIDAFKLWCWRRLLRVPWTVRRSNQSILREINPEYSLEGLMLKLKLQYFGHLM